MTSCAKATHGGDSVAETTRPMCPWCGKRMMSAKPLWNDLISSHECFAICPSCHARGPVVKDTSATIAKSKAIKLVQPNRIKLAIPNTPLTMGQLLDGSGCDFDGVKSVFYEANTHRRGEVLCPVVYCIRVAPDSGLIELPYDGWKPIDSIMGYGKNWRCWGKSPSYEEVKKAKWAD